MSDQANRNGGGNGTPSDVPFGSLALYESATEEIYRRDYGDLVQLRTGQRELLTFRLGKELYAVDLKGILEVTRHSAITPVPLSPRWVVGVMFLRGNVVPVFHVGRMLHVSGESESEGEGAGTAPSERVLMVARRKAGGAIENVVGLLVDEVREVIAVPDEDVGPVPSTISGAGAEFIVGIARKGPNLYGLLNQVRVAAQDTGGSGA